LAIRAAWVLKDVLKKLAANKADKKTLLNELIAQDLL
jgi:hypothetical protein